MTATALGRPRTSTKRAWETFAVSSRRPGIRVFRRDLIIASKSSDAAQKKCVIDKIASRACGLGRVWGDLLFSRQPWPTVSQST